jgi:transglutaminase-like putative cysteine protease
MPLDQVFRFASIWLASISFIGLTLGASLPEWLVALTGAALIIALLRNVRSYSLERLATVTPISATGWNLLVIGGFLGFWVDMLWVSSELLSAGVHFLMILMIIKLFNLKLRRDHLHLSAISLVAILVSGALTADLWCLPIFVLYLLASVWMLLLFHFTKHQEETQALTISAYLQPQPRASVGQVTRQLFWLANGLALATFSLTLVIFFTIPRVSAGFYHKGFGENIRTSGFSEMVNLGEIGPIKRDPSVVMRVELSDGISHETGRFYMRGVAFDQYDGRTWTNRLNYRQSMSEDANGTFVLRRNRAPAPSRLGEPIRQNVLLEPLDTPVLFTAPFVEEVSGKFPSVQSDFTGSVYLPFPSLSRIEYSVLSRSNPVLPADLSSEPVLYPESFARHFLQVPAQSERVAALADEVTHAQRTTYDKANAVQSFLMHNFRYSLDAPLTEQARPLEEFLFARKTGYCEHYATAMVVMLRTIGIPARLVTGFLATEWNEYGRYYVVRQQDAHAWVEVYLPHSGWITMDPTPPSIEGVGRGPSAWHALGSMIDAIRLQWNRFFVQYSAADQLAAVQRLKAGSILARNKAFDSIGVLLNPFMAAFGGMAEYVSKKITPSLVEVLGSAVIGLTALLWLGIKWYLAHGKVYKKTTLDDQLIMQIYGQMIRHLARRGIEKLAVMPPLEFVRLAHERWSEAGSAVAFITELYCRTRFGRTPLTKEELSRAEDHLRNLMALDKR